MLEIDKHADSSKIVKYLVGNCADELDKESSKRKISYEEALQFMKKHDFSHYVETSSKTGRNVD